MPRPWRPVKQVPSVNVAAAAAVADVIVTATAHASHAPSVALTAAKPVLRVKLLPMWALLPQPQ